MSINPDLARKFAAAVQSLQRGDLPAAARIARELADNEAMRNDDNARMQLADLCMHCELYFAARDLYRPFESTLQDDVSLHYKSGTAAYKTRDIASAGRHFQRCVELRPEHPVSYLQLGHVRKAERDFDLAADCYLAFVERAEGDKGQGFWSLADLKDFRFDDDLVTAMRQHLENCDPRSAEASYTHFALALALEQRQDNDDAVVHFDAANAIQAGLRPFRESAYQALLESIRGAEYAAGEPRELDSVPIFIVGLPRSGTTLVEQILAAHSEVTATDELPYMERIGFELERSGGYGQRLAALTADEVAQYRERYLLEAGAYLPADCAFFIDKSTNNFMHIGLIRRLFPEALIINLRRDLRDNAISIYRQMFATGHDYSSGFASIQSYAAGYLSMMDHWLAQYPSAIRVQSYESLVEDPDTEIAGLLDFCGLASEPACFEFYKSRETVMTPSASQVSQPMYTTSIGRWQVYADAYGAEFDALDALQTPTKN